MSEFWMKWEGEVINGLYPLRRFLDSSTHSAVFLTEDSPHQAADAAIKFIRADPPSTELELARWRAAAALSHPHLVRLFEAGECRMGTYHLLFIVMEYAEQTLAQVLLHRALTIDETRQMLRPLCDALAFLHRNGWVHREVKPTNVCVVNDEVKLASDTIRRGGERSAGASAGAGDGPSIYAPPEAKDGRISTAGDIWSLAMTTVAALTGRAAAGPDQTADPLSLPSAVPPEFADLLQRCLSREPSGRPTITEFQAALEEPVTAAPVPEAPAPKPANVRPISPKPARSRISPGLVVGGIALLSAVVWGGMHLMRAEPKSIPAPPRSASIASAPARASASSPAAPAPAPTSAPPPATASRGVLHKEIPVVPSGALRTVRGHIRVTVRVTVDPSGKVVDEAIRYPGSSKYFARLAADAAKKWRFERAANQASREWLLQFDFSREGAGANAEPRS
jgi:outer membrane biosynthesis protein TonB